MLRFLDSIRFAFRFSLRGFTDQSVNALVAARKHGAAQALHNINPEHVLLGVATLRRRCGARVILGNLGLDLKRDTMVVTALANAHTPGLSQDAPTLAPETQSLLSRAREHARGLGQNYVGTEHLLLGLLGGTGQAADYFRERGITLDRFLAELRIQLAGRNQRPNPK